MQLEGNGSNGGETPDIVGDEDLKVQYQVVANPFDAPDAGSWTELGIVIDAVPNGSGTGVLDNYDIALPEAAQGEYVYIRLQQDSNSGPNNDHYGILSVSFIEALVGDPNGPRYSNKQVILTTNPLETGSPTPAEAMALGKRIDRLEVVDGGEGFATVDPNQTEVYIKTLPSQGQIDDLLASVTLGKETTFDIVDGGYGYDSTVPSTIVVSPPTADTDLPTARATYDENGSLLTLEIEKQGSFDWTVVGVDLTHRTVGENNLTKVWKRYWIPLRCCSLQSKIWWKPKTCRVCRTLLCWWYAELHCWRICRNQENLRKGSYRTMRSCNASTIVGICSLH